MKILTISSEFQLDVQGLGFHTWVWNYLEFGLRFDNKGGMVSIMEEHSNQASCQYHFPKMTHSCYFHYHKQGFQRILNLENSICQVD